MTGNMNKTRPVFQKIHGFLKPYYIFVLIFALWWLVSVLGIWNNYLLPTLMLAKYPEQKTLVVAVVQLQSTGGAGASQYNLMMAGTMLAAMPMIILFLCLNKMFVAGITQGAVKG